MKKNNSKTVIWVVLFAIIAAIFVFCIYCFAVVIPEKREADRRALEEQQKQQELQMTMAPTEAPTKITTPVPTLEPTVAPTEDEAPHEHTWEVKEIPATCSAEGKTWEECTCGQVKNEVYHEMIPHEKTTYKVVVEPTTEADGVYETICDACGAVVESGKINMLETVATPTPTEAPKATATPTPTPTAAPHKHTWEEKKIEPLCETAGKTWEECSICGETRNEKTIERLRHKWETVEEIKATVETQGFYTDVCAKCGETVSNYLPKLTPTPTPTPVPNANNPRLVLSKHMGDNITFEFWDNGYLYIKGTGRTYDQRGSFHWDKDRVSSGLLPREFIATLKHLVVEEGVTYLGNNIFADIDKHSKFETATLPKSLVSMSDADIGVRLYANKVTLYYNGKQCIASKKAGETIHLEWIYLNVGDEELMKERGITVEWK